MKSCLCFSPQLVFETCWWGWVEFPHFHLSLLCRLGAIPVSVQRTECNYRETCRHENENATMTVRRAINRRNFSRKLTDWLEVYWTNMQINSSSSSSYCLHGSYHIPSQAQPPKESYKMILENMKNSHDPSVYSIQLSITAKSFLCRCTKTFMHAIHPPKSFD